MGVVVLALFAPMAAEAASFTVTAPTTDTVQKSVDGTDTGTIQSGATLAVTGGSTSAIVSTGTSSGVVITNSGTVTSAYRGIETGGSIVGFTINNQVGALVNTVDNAFHLNSLAANGLVTINNSGTVTSSSRAIQFANNAIATATVQLNNSATGILRSTASDAIRAGGGTLIVDNSGLISAATRAISMEPTSLATATAFVITNRTGATITSADDTLRITGSAASAATTALNVQIDNAGTIQSTGSGQAFDFADLNSRNATVSIVNREGAVIRAAGNDAIRPGSGTISITNSGLIDATGSANRAINLNPADLASVQSLQVINNVGGVIQSQDDTVRISGTAGTTTTAIQILVDNAGIIRSTGTGAAGGQAIDFDGITSAASSVNIINRATGVISSADADAIRPGQNFTLTNYGQIIANAVAVPTDRPSADAIDLQTGHTGTVYNYGTISGAKSGTASDVGSNLTVYNYADGTITGRNGSGVGSGGNATVYNWGTITGAIDSTSLRGDGDGIDVDYVLTLTNYGLIQGTGAKGYDAGGRLNNSEGLAVGGGTFLNYGTIRGAGAGIVVNNDSNPDNSRGGSAAASIVNYAGGTIVGQNSYAIRMEAKTGTAIDNDSIVNYGTIIGNGTIADPNSIVLREDGTPDPGSVGTLNGVTYTGTGSARFIRGDGSAIQMGEGTDVLTNYGTIIGNTGRAVNMEGGNDTVNIMNGSRILGLVDGGAGTDTLNYNKVGLGEANRAALMAGQTVNIGGTLYTSFEVVNANAPSFSALAGANSKGIAALFDNLPLNATGLGVVDMLDRVASTGDVGAALSQLTPGSYQSLGRIGMNNVQQTTSLVGQHLTQNRINGLGTDVSGLGNALAMFDGGMFDRNVGGDRALAAVMSFPGSAGSSLAEAGWGTGVADAMAYAPINKAPALRPIAVTADHGFFVTSGASFAREGARADAPGFKANTVNVLAGYDQRISSNIVAGVFGGYAFTRADTDATGSNARIGTGTIGGYGTYQASTWFASLMGLYGFSDYTTSRIAVGTSNDAKFNGDHYAIRGTVGTDIRVSGWVVTPELGLQYMRVMTDGFTERGAATALVVGSDSSESLRSSVGARFAYDYAINGGVLTPELRFAWLHEFSDGIRGINASFADTTLPGSFVTSTASGIRDRGVLGAGLSGKLAPLTVLSVNYDAIVGGSDTVTHQVMGRIKHAF